MRIFVAFLIALLTALTAAEATTVQSLGIPVTAIGSMTHSVPTCPTLEGQSCYNAATGSINFFIPVSPEKSGVFGVTDVGGGQTAGTLPDVGGGTESSVALTMFLLFSPIAVPTDTATMTFSFVDLDLANVNDPYGFFESVKFYKADGTEVTPWITMAPQSGSSPLPFSVMGDADQQTILFPDVTSIVTDPFFMELRFKTSYSSLGKNTPESMIATLTTASVPEPGTAAMLGTGLLALGVSARWLGRRRKP